MTVSSADRGQVEDLLRTIAATDTTTMRKILRGSREETTKAFANPRTCVSSTYNEKKDS